MSTHTQQLLKDMRNTQPNKTRRFKMLTENSLVDYNNIPHPPLVPCENSSPVKNSHSISHEGSNLATEDYGKNVTSLIPNSLLDGNHMQRLESHILITNEWWQNCSSRDCNARSIASQKAGRSVGSSLRLRRKYTACPPSLLNCSI